MPGASAYFLGGAVVYTQTARKVLFDLGDLSARGMRASTEPYARLLAQTARERFASTWALAESGATGPTGNRYGDVAGHCCLAVAGPIERALTIETGDADRLANMRAFSAAALDLLAQELAS
jgi:nicotinamide mononucleotide (NMN) deamidase PncC